MDTALPVLFIGPISAGKTALIRSSINNQQEIFPTPGVEINYITSTSRTILTYDCSGEGTARTNWTLLSAIAQSVVYVIDSHDTDGFVWAKRYLYHFLQQHKAMRYFTSLQRKKTLCIMLNKSDIKGRLPKQLMVKALQPQKLCTYVFYSAKLVSKYYIKQTSAFNKDGIDECLQWIIKSTTVPKQQ